MRRAAVLTVLAILILWPQAAPAQDQAPRLENLVPDNTFLYVSMPDVGSACDQFKRTSLAKLWNEPEVQQFLAPGLKLIHQELKKAEKKVNHPILSVLAGIRGQVSLAVVEYDPMFGGLIPDAVAMVDLGGGMADFQKIHREAIEKHGDQLRISKKEHAGVTYERMVIPNGLELCIAYLGTALVVTPRADRMNSVIDGFQGRLANPLSANPTYQAVKTKVGGGGIVHAFVNLESIVDYFGERLPPEASKAVDAMGLGGVKGLGYGSAFVGEGVRDTFYAHIPGEKTGLTKVMYASAGDGTQLLSRVPKKAFYAASGRANLEAAWDGIFEMMGEIEPFMVDQVKGQLAGAEDFLGLSIKEDLIKPMGDEMCLYASLPEGGGIIPDIVFMAKMDDGGHFLESMSQLVNKAAMLAEQDGQYEVEIRSMQFMGKTIYYVHVSHEYGDPFPVTPSVVLDGDLMVMALYPQVLKDFIARGNNGPSILDRPDFQRVRKGLPANLTSIEYMDYQVGAKWLYGTMVPLAQMFVKDKKCPVDMALLPRTETIAKHLFGGAWGVEMTDSGVAMHAYTPTGLMPLMAVGMAGALVMSRQSQAQIPVMVFRDPEPPVAEAEPEPRELPPSGGATRGKLEEIYIGLLYHYAQSDEFPADLGELLKSKSLEKAETLLIDGDQAPATTPSGHKSSFIYVGPGVGQDMAHLDALVWVYEGRATDAGRWVLFGSGQVERVSEERLKVLLEETHKLLQKK